MCDPDLLFMYAAVAAPGETNDCCAFTYCTALVEWLKLLSDDYFIPTDNAYGLSCTLMLPFSGSEILDEVNRTYNFYLSRLRIRIEMAFGLLTTKWR